MRRLFPPGDRPAQAPNPLARTEPDPQTRALVDELPYLDCGELDGFGPLHLLADGTLGYAFAVAVPTVDTVVEGEQAAATIVTTMLHALAPGVHWQWFLHTDPCVARPLERYRCQPGHDAAGRLFADAFVERWRAAQRDGFFPDDPECNFHPRTQRIVLALKSEPLGWTQPGLSDVASLMPPGLQAALEPLIRRLGRNDGALRRAAGFVGSVRDVLLAAQANGWETHAIDADELVEWVASLLFPQRLLAPAPAEGGAEAKPRAGLQTNETRVAIAALGRVESISPAGFCTWARGVPRHHRVVSMLWQPRAVTPGMLNFLATLRPHLCVTLSAAAQSPAASLLALKARALLNARSTHRFNATEMQARSDALEEVEQRMFADGERIFETRLQVMVAEPSAEEADRAAASIAKHLATIEIEACVEESIGSTLLLRACLPFAVYPETERKLRRRRRLLTRDCADLHPGGGCWTGVAPEPPGARLLSPAPVVLYSNPLGEPLFIDPTKAEKNPHALVVGQSGSGKSFFVHDYLLHLWRLPDVRLFLISIKADYRKLALLLGRYVEIGLDSDIGLNPFCGAPNLENQARWFAALALMLHQDRGEADLPREAEIALQTAAMAAAQRNWDAQSDRPIRETLLEHVCLELERAAGPLGRQLALQLHPYRRGPYRRLFNAPRGIPADERFVFFNLGNILRQPCAALASFCVFGLVDEVMTDPRLRAVPKGLIADEVWALVRNPHAAAILERSLKAYRSLGAFALPIVQDPQDLDTPSGRVMLVNTATKVILPLDRAGQSDLQRYVRLNEREVEIVRNLRLFKRRYSEFFVSIDGMKSAKGLLIPDPLRYAVATTDPADEECIERHFRECGDMLAAVQRFARESPYGIRRQPAQPLA
jgi:hypothetical protein